MRAVVDTNVLVSALLGSKGPPGAILSAITGGRLQPVVCRGMLAEYAEVLARPRLRISQARSAELLKLVEQVADWVAVPAWPGSPPLPDPDDWPFVAAALVAGCPLITGNGKDLPAQLGVRVMGVREWVDSVR